MKFNFLLGAKNFSSSRLPFFSNYLREIFFMFIIHTDETFLYTFGVPSQYLLKKGDAIIILRSLGNRSYCLAFSIVFFPSYRFNLELIQCQVEPSLLLSSLISIEFAGSPVTSLTSFDATFQNFVQDCTRKKYCESSS